MTEQEALAIVAEFLVRSNPGSRYCPQTPTPKQQEFLDLDCREALFGGAAGGGKSSTLLMGALQYVHVPGYAALLLRRSYADLSLPGALMDRASEWLRGTDARWRDKDKQWRFSSGASITFGYLQHENDKYRYQGSEYQYIALDELTQFSETQYRYMLSRLRRLAGSDVPIRARGASNPGGVGHVWVYNRFVDPDTYGDRVFVPSRLGDNPHIDADEYRKMLAELDEITRRQLEDGEWVQGSTGLVYDWLWSRNAVDKLPELDPGEKWKHILGIDLGASEEKKTTAFAILAFSEFRRQVYTRHTEKHAGMTPSDIAERTHELTSRYPTEQTVMDAGALGKGYVLEFQQRWALPVKAASKSNKLGYRKLYNGDLQHGNHFVVAQNCPDLISEFNVLTWDEKGADNLPDQDNHVSDADLYAWRDARHWLATEKPKMPPTGTREYEQWIQRQLRDRHIAKMKAKQTSRRKR